jgi:DNA-binding XRE family transcriptional regulator
MKYKSATPEPLPPVLRLPQDLGLAFQQARKAQKRTQEWVAKRAGVSRFTVTQLEAGENVGIHHLMALLAALGYGLVFSGARPTFENLTETYRDDD